MLKLCIGNRLDKLLVSLNINMKSNLSPLTKTTVCVQTSGMQRWVGLELAKLSGISANLDYVFPAALIKRMAERHTGRKNLWMDKDELTWSVFREILRLDNTEYNRPIINYLKDDNGTVKAFRLAGRIADVFDQYQLYRPEMILRWFSERTFSEEEIWQAELFKKVFTDKNRCKTYVLHRMLKDMMQGQKSPLKETVHLFGLSVIPPFFIDILNVAGETSDIHLYLLNPSEEYWGDSISEKEISRLERWHRKSAEELMLYQNNPLLDNLGTLGRDFFDILLDKTGFANADYPYEKPEPKSILSTIHTEIYELEPQKEETISNDGSITVASCHNPLREVESLNDYLLELFNNDSTLTPSDILVMCTDVQTYAPYIRAVFDNPYSDKTAIPYTIADLPHRQTSRPAGVFSEILQLLTGEFNLSTVMKVLSDKIVAPAFGISKSENISEILDRNGAYYGITHDDISEIKADTPFTFHRAMQRIALGLAEGTSRHIYREPAGDDVPFSMAEELGGIMRFTELCGIYREKLAEDMAPAERCSLLSEIADSFMTKDVEYSDDIVFLTSCIADIKGLTSDFTDKISSVPVIETLNAMLDNASGSKGFITGKTTFCAMLPMRSIPFRVICILGLNDSSFPRLKTGLEFDLIAKHHKKGDRTQRDSDKYLFLETIISAQEKLYLSYTGRSESDNKELVPSILITELLRYLEKRFGVKDAVTQHRLHSFSLQYFKNDNQLYTYSPLRFEAAKALTERKTDKVFCPEPIILDEISTIDLASFERFFINPPKYFLENVLGIKAEVTEDTLPDTEKMNLNHLDIYKLKDASLSTAMKGKDPEMSLLYAAKTAKLPAGGLGEHYRSDFAQYGLMVADTVKDYGADGYRDVTYTSKGITISGRIQGTGNGKHVYIKTGKIKAKDLMRTWIRHLLLNLEEPVTSYIVTSENEIKIPPIEPKESLENLVSLFLKGLTQPLYFNPVDGIKLLSKEIKKIEFDDFGKIENDTAFKICFGDFKNESELLEITKSIFEPCAMLMGNTDE